MKVASYLNKKPQSRGLGGGMKITYTAPCAIEKEVIDKSNGSYICLNIRISWDKELTEEELKKHIEFAKGQLDLLLCK